MRIPGSTARGPSGLRPIGLSAPLYLAVTVSLAYGVAFVLWGDCFLRTYARECVEQRIPAAEKHLGFQLGSIWPPGDEKNGGHWWPSHKVVP